MTTPLPMHVAVTFAHASLQVLAEDAGVDLLHVKGPAIDPLLAGGRLEETSGRGPSSDADVLVRPSHVKAMLCAMRAHGWGLQYRFADGSAFEHAATLWHEGVGHADIHRSFPGIRVDADAAFEILWRERGTRELAGVECAVPNLTGQRLILLLHAARDVAQRRWDITRCWDEATPDERREVEQLARRLGAEVALAAATGRLEDYADRREHDLWQLLSSGHRADLQVWKARVKAQPTLLGRVRTGARLLTPKLGRSRTELGRALTPAEVLSAYRQRLRLGAREVSRVLRSGWESRR